MLIVQRQRTISSKDLASWLPHKGLGSREKQVGVVRSSRAEPSLGFYVLQKTHRYKQLFKINWLNRCLITIGITIKGQQKKKNDFTEI